MAIGQTKAAGFSLIELMMVIGLLTLIMGIATPYTRSLNLTTNRNSTLEIFTNFIQSAQNNAFIKKSNTTWGVCLNNNQLHLYKTSCTTTNIQATYDLPPDISINNFSNLVFDKRGELVTSQTVTIVSTDKTINVTINQLGTIDVN